MHASDCAAPDDAHVLVAADDKPAPKYSTLSVAGRFEAKLSNVTGGLLASSVTDSSCPPALVVDATEHVI